MGLDCYWVGENDSKASVPGKFKICGGMFSGHGNDSFRGKVYNDVVESETGVSLYQEEIDSETIKKMAETLGNIKWNSQFGFKYNIDSDEFTDLVRMFKAHADEGHKIRGWW